MTDWFSSDHHFLHERINALAGRPFSSVEEATETMVERWNERVKPGDTGYLLGDVCMGPLELSLALLERLNGLLFLVPGNHDRVSSLYRGSENKKREWWVAYRDAGLLVLPEQHPTLVGGKPALLCHFPYTGDSHDEDRYRHARPVDRGGWLLHGHTHQKERVSCERQIHVGVDAWDFAPVSEHELVELMR